jgi:ABC-type spermidine/putrescine transport system permease subunit II
MDSITQAALGGALGGAVLGHRFGRAAVVAGALFAFIVSFDEVVIALFISSGPKSNSHTWVASSGYSRPHSRHFSARMNPTLLLMLLLSLR